MPQDTVSAKLALYTMNVAGEGRGPADTSHPKLVLYSHDLNKKPNKDCLEKWTYLGLTNKCYQLHTHITEIMYTLSSFENVQGEHRGQGTASEIDIKKGFTDHGRSEHAIQCWIYKDKYRQRNKNQKVCCISMQ